MSPRTKAALRYLLVFVVALGALATVAGKRLGKPSRDNHFVRLADGWMQGRLSLEGKPPGWCGPKERAHRKCRNHSFDDYAVLYALTLPDGTTARGYPCRTEACKSARRKGEATWYIVGQGWQNFERREIRRGEDTWYITFPPGPAALLLPFVAIWGLGTLDVLLTCIAAALIPLLLVVFLDRERGTEDGRGRQHLWLGAAWALASPAFFLGANGRVWFTAQVFGALCLMLYLNSAWNVRRPALAGLWLALAVACRPINMAPAVIIFGYEWWRNGKKPAELARFALPLAIVGSAIAWHNYVRFEDIFEFGHRFLEIRWQARMQEIGMFSTEYLARNLECLLWLAPKVGDASPHFRVSIHGMALWMSSPWIFAALVARRSFPQRWVLLLAIVGAAAPSLLYQNSGQLQPVYRFAADWLLLLLLLIGLGAGARRKWFAPLVVLAVVLNGWVAWQFGRAPGHLFVTQPLGWPFAHELEQG